jgi:hypothetical protein
MITKQRGSRPILITGLLAVATSLSSAADQTKSGDPAKQPAPVLRIVDEDQFEFPQPLLGAEGARPIEEDLQALKQQRFQELRRQLDELSRLLPAEENRETASPSQEFQLAPIPIAVPAPVSTDVPPPYMDVRLPDIDARPPELQPVPENPTATPKLEATPEQPDSGPPDVISPLAPQSSAKPVTGPIDRFSLAVSLFGSRQWDVCLNVLDNVPPEQLPREDYIWGEYMKACCHRHCGRTEEAQHLYRRILGETDAGWVAELARWWLDNLEEKKRLQQDAQRLAETLKAWETEIGTLSSQPR